MLKVEKCALKKRPVSKRLSLRFQMTNDSPNGRLLSKMGSKIWQRK